MALEVRRIVTGHDSQGKAIVATDERLSGTGAAGRAGISRVDVWSTDKMPIDNSDAAAELQRKGFVVRHNYVGSGQGSVCRVVEFAPGGAKFMHRTETSRLRDLPQGRMRPRTRRRPHGADEGGRHLRAARHDARLGRQGLGARGLRLRPDRRRACREGGKKADDPLPDALTEALAGCCLGRQQVVLVERHHRANRLTVGIMAMVAAKAASRTADLLPIVEALFTTKRQITKQSVSDLLPSVDQSVRKPAYTEGVVAGAGPLRGNRSATRLRGADNARDPELAICSHPRLGEIRDDGCPSRAGLRGCHRRDRADSHKRLTAELSRPTGRV